MTAPIDKRLYDGPADAAEDGGVEEHLPDMDLDREAGGRGRFSDP